MQINWSYDGCWAVFPSLVDTDTQVPAGLTFLTERSIDEDHSMRLVIESPGPLTVREIEVRDRWPNADASIPFPKRSE